jgi:S1-C subfamily serine protease
VKHGRVVRGWVGVVVQPLNAATVKAFGLTGEPRGALVADVTPSSPADRGGLLAGDIVLEIDGTPVKDSRDLSLAIGAKSPGDLVRLNAFRQGLEREFNITLGEQPSKTEPRTGQREDHSAGFGIGLSVQTLTPNVLRQIGLPAQTRGVIVTNVDPASPGEDAGVAPGDVIIEVNRKAISTLEEFETAIREAAKKPILLLIERSGARMFIVVEPK